MFAAALVEVDQSNYILDSYKRWKEGIDHPYEFKFSSNYTPEEDIAYWTRTHMLMAPKVDARGESIQRMERLGFKPLKKAPMEMALRVDPSFYFVIQQTEFLENLCVNLVESEIFEDIGLKILDVEEEEVVFPVSVPLFNMQSVRRIQVDDESDLIELVTDIQEQRIGFIPFRLTVGQAELEGLNYIREFQMSFLNPCSQLFEFNTDESDDGRYYHWRKMRCDFRIVGTGHDGQPFRVTVIQSFHDLDQLRNQPHLIFDGGLTHDIASMAHAPHVTLYDRLWCIQEQFVLPECYPLAFDVEFGRMLTDQNGRKGSLLLIVTTATPRAFPVTVDAYIEGVLDITSQPEIRPFCMRPPRRYACHHFQTIAMRMASSVYVAEVPATLDNIVLNYKVSGINIGTVRGVRIVVLQEFSQSERHHRWLLRQMQEKDRYVAIDDSLSSFCALADFWVDQHNYNYMGANVGCVFRLAKRENKSSKIYILLVAYEGAAMVAQFDFRVAWQNDCDEWSW
jgi:hypothetical protein